MNKKFIKVTKSRAYWSNSKTTHTLAVTCNELTHMIEWLIDNTYVLLVIKFCVKLLAYLLEQIAHLF